MAKQQRRLAFRDLDLSKKLDLPLGVSRDYQMHFKAPNDFVAGILRKIAKFDGTWNNLFKRPANLALRAKNAGTGYVAELWPANKTIKGVYCPRKYFDESTKTFYLWLTVTHKGVKKDEPKSGFYKETTKPKPTGASSGAD